MSKTTILHAFFYISPPSLHNYGVKWSNFVVDLRRERQRDKFYYLSLNLDTVPSLQFQPNVHTLSHWATWYEGEKVSMDAKSIFQRRFHERRRCRIIRSLFSGSTTLSCVRYFQAENVCKTATTTITIIMIMIMIIIKIIIIIEKK